MEPYLVYRPTTRQKQKLLIDYWALIDGRDNKVPFEDRPELPAAPESPIALELSIAPESSITPESLLLANQPLSTS
jgi:hypothetical protein